MTATERAGRVLKCLHPEMFEELLTTNRELLNDAKYVKQIHNQVNQSFVMENDFNRLLLFIASCYELYEPLSFFFIDGEGVSAKLPQGVRDEMSKCLGFNNPEMVNAYKSYCDPHMKPKDNGVVRPFKIKVDSIVELFEPFSIHKTSQCNLFG